MVSTRHLFYVYRKIYLSIDDQLYLVYLLSEKCLDNLDRIGKKQIGMDMLYYA